MTQRTFDRDGSWRIAYKKNPCTLKDISTNKQELTISDDNITVEPFATEGEARQHVADLGLEWPAED